MPARTRTRAHPRSSTATVASGTFRALDEQMQDIVGLGGVAARVQGIGDALLVVHQGASAVQQALALRGRVAGRDVPDAVAEGGDGGGDGEGAEVEGVGAAFEVAGRDFDPEGDVGRGGWGWGHDAVGREDGGGDVDSVRGSP